MRTTDNNGGNCIIDISNINDLAHIANCTLTELLDENNDLLIFPQSLGIYGDDIAKGRIFSLHQNNLQTYNLMGFVGRNDTQLTISSRFAPNDQKDYFLHYMLQRVFAVNLFDFDQTYSKENIWDFLLYLFPYYLKKAFTQGLYKAYQQKTYNDANIKGTIDVKRHIIKNIPFAGKIAYTTREYSYDNHLNQLIRHTIEYIKIHPFGSGILTADSNVRDIVNRFVYITQNTYNHNARQKVISANTRPFVHPYFTEYTPLQKLCLKILRREKLTFGSEKDKVYGLLFDGAWLWEEYLNTILKEYFIHPQNKTGKHKNYLFQNDNKSFQAIYPDFISKSEPKKVGDAKYIPLDRQKEYGEASEKATSIYYKTITYMYRFNAKNGLLLFPCNTSFYKEYFIKETEGILRKIGLAIPQSVEDFKEFIAKMQENEKLFLEKTIF